MRAIYLNHSQTLPMRTTSWLLLAAGLIVLTLVWIFWQYVHAQNTTLRLKLEAKRLQTVAQRQPLNKVPDAQTEAARAAIKEIMLPWASLLKALESANLDSVKMLALEPNAKTGITKLSLVALDQADMWLYLGNLKQQEALREVRLLSNESVDVNGVRAQAFWVEVKWLP